MLSACTGSLATSEIARVGGR